MRGFWENVWQFIPRLRLFFCKVEISSRALIPHFIYARISPQWLSSLDDCYWMFPDELPVSSFPEVPTLCLDSSIVSPLWLCWVKGVCIFRCNLPPALLAEWLGSFTCHCGNAGVERTLNELVSVGFAVMWSQNRSDTSLDQVNWPHGSSKCNVEYDELLSSEVEWYHCENWKKNSGLVV